MTRHSLRIRTKRLLLLGFAFVVLLATAVTLPGLVIGLRCGEASGWPWDAARLAGCANGLVAAFGLLFYREWARRDLAILLVPGLFWVLSLVFILRGGPWDATGVLLMAGVVTIYALMFWFLISAREVTANPPAFSSRNRAFLGMLTVVAGVGLWKLSILDYEDEDRQGSVLDLAGSLDLDFLASPRTWRLEALSAAGYERGDMTYVRVPVGPISVLSSGGVATIEGVPLFRNLELKVDLRRNVLFVGGEIFRGTTFETERFAWRSQRVRGVKFERESGWITGAITLGERQDGTLFLAATPLVVMGKTMERIYAATTERRPPGPHDSPCSPPGAGSRVMFPGTPAVRAWKVPDGTPGGTALWTDPEADRTLRLSWALVGTFDDQVSLPELLDDRFSEKLERIAARVVDKRALTIEGRSAVEAAYQVEGRYVTERWVADPSSGKLWILAMSESTAARPTLAGADFFESFELPEHQRSLEERQPMLSDTSNGSPGH